MAGLTLVQVRLLGNLAGGGLACYILIAIFVALAGFFTYMRLQQKPALTGKVPVGWMWAMGIAWTVASIWFFVWVYHSPYFEGFYRDKFPTPTYGTGGVFWAACTLALLTLPVVIVATEEALAAVPRSMREGSMAVVRRNGRRWHGSLFRAPCQVS